MIEAYCKTKKWSLVGLINISVGLESIQVDHEFAFGDEEVVVELFEQL